MSADSYLRISTYYASLYLSSLILLNDGEVYKFIKVISKKTRILSCLHKKGERKIICTRWCDAYNYMWMRERTVRKSEKCVKTGRNIMVNNGENEKAKKSIDT